MMVPQDPVPKIFRLLHAAPGSAHPGKDMTVKQTKDGWGEWRELMLINVTRVLCKRDVFQFKVQGKRFPSTTSLDLHRP